MIKVRVTRHASTGFPVVSSLVALSSAFGAGCAVPPVEPQDTTTESLGTSESALSASAISAAESLSGDSAIAQAGSGAISLYGYSLAYESTSAGDEFIRVSERMRIRVNQSFLLAIISYQEPAIFDILGNDPNKLEVSAKVTYTKFDDTAFDARPFPLAWGAAAPDANVIGQSKEFSIPKGVKRLKVAIEARYKKDGIEVTRAITGNLGIPNEFVVFGGFLLNKLALFDTSGGARRTRIVEGGAVVRGAGLMFSVTDWRLDTVVDKTALDLRYGRRYNYSRFGSAIVDALGQLDYVVKAVYSTDGGKTWRSTDFSKAANANVFGAYENWRFAYQSQINVPTDAGPNVKIAFHVQAYLQVPNYSPGDAFDTIYAPGARILLRDVWDNADNANYELAVGNR